METNTLTEKHLNRKIAILLLTGLIGAVLVGAGEFMEQFVANADHSNKHYEFFHRIPLDRIIKGHFLAVFSIPLYFPGYLGIYYAIKKSWQSAAILAGGLYSITVGGIWLGMRSTLALTQHNRVLFSNTENQNRFIENLSQLNEPLIEIVRIVIFGVSILYFINVIKGRSNLPRWMAFTAPGIWLILIFLLYILQIPGGDFLISNAMNVAHIIFFATPLLFLLRMITHATNK